MVLAAGGSTRLGEPKQLIEFRGEPLVRRAARAASEAGADPVFVVLGCEEARIACALEGVASVAIVQNERWRDGLASSLVAGMREVLRLDRRADAVLIMAADQPLVGAIELCRLLDGLKEGHRIVAAEYDETVGVPAVIGCEHLAALLALEGDAGAGRWLRAQGGAVRRIHMEEAAVDIDTASDRVLLALR